MNLLETLKDLVGSRLTKHSAEFLNEEEADTRVAVDGTYSALLASVINKGSTEKGAKDLMGMLKNPKTDILDNIDNIFTRSPGTINGLVNRSNQVLPAFMGNNQRKATNLIAAKSGISKNSSSKMMKFSTPFLMSLLGKHVEENKLDEAGLMNFLKGQKSHVTSVLPEDMIDTLELENFGWTKKVEVVEEPVKKKKVKKEREFKKEEKIVQDRPSTKNEVLTTADDELKSPFGFMKWLLPLIIILALASFFGLRGCAGVDKVTNAVASTAEKTVQTAGNVATDAAGAVAGAAKSTFGAVNDMALKALDGIQFTAGSVGSQMMNFMKGGGSGDARFRFNNLNFASGSATISNESMAEVNNLASILKAYTDVTVNVEGYTDNTGNADANITLSQRRADAVRTQLIAQGIAEGRILTKGFGAASPVADNGTAEGRAENRRIEVVIVK